MSATKNAAARALAYVRRALRVLGRERECTCPPGPLERDACFACCVTVELEDVAWLLGDASLVEDGTRMLRDLGS